MIFTIPEGTPLHHSNFRRRIWLPALRDTGLTSIHFHDLRHTGNTLAASAGAISKWSASASRAVAAGRADGGRLVRTSHFVCQRQSLG
jgi:integrase